MCEPIPSGRLASSQLRCAHQDGIETSLALDSVIALMKFSGVVVNA
jgi:hypothetical protein